MKMKLKFAVAMAVGAMAVGAMAFCIGVKAAEINTLGAEAGVKYGATHALVVSVNDLVAATNTATFSCLITNLVIPAGGYLEPKSLVVDIPFGGVTNSYNTTTVSVGDLSNTNLFINGVQVASNGTNTPVYLASASTLQVATIAATNGTWSVVTNIVSSSKYYSTANDFAVLFTGQTNYALSAYTRGQFSFYFRLIRP